MKRLNSILLGTSAAILVLGGMPASAQKAPDASGGAQIQGGANVQGGGVQGGADAGGKAGVRTESGGASAGGKTEGRGSGSVQTQSGESGGQAEGRGSGSVQTQTGGSNEQTQSQSREGSGASVRGGSEGRALSEPRGDRNSNVRFSSEHKTKVRTYFKQNSVTVDPVRDIGISVSVGTAVPSQVILHPLPRTIVVDLPPEREYVYFVYGNDIVVVDAHTREIIDIIPDVA